MFVLRYVWSVTPHFARASVVAVVLGAGGIWMVHALPADRGAPYVPLLFAQLFVAASGFRPSADRGWFDPLLVTCPSRVQLALAHWFWSTAPGATAWMVTAGAEWLLGDAVNTVGWSAPGFVALWLVSSVSWSVTLPGSPYWGGVAWTVVMVAVGISPRGVAWVREAVFETSAGDLPGMASAVSALVVCPFLLLVPRVDVASRPDVLAAVSLIGFVSLMLGVWWIHRRDYPGLN